ncbi:hypothetical protein RFI_02021 [Reticulomyxa filosa]|uniref:Uncharacterized protein n=1 Tax=Reticulomyxa filosa TaxID=46433 RepID=X6PA96_RETFI|nr:hypothetical protein RFI_02021 [Reticulomyxa filosa]|eukprot:ETO35053.1 hypothetical protein RFI_02021 [Reticulomyxa filosa]
MRKKYANNNEILFSFQNLYLLNKGNHFSFLLTLCDLKKKVKKYPFHHLDIIKDHLKEKKNIFSFVMKSKEEEVQIIIHYWIRKLKIKLGWIKDFDKFIVNYVSSFVLSFLKCKSEYSNIYLT